MFNRKNITRSLIACILLLTLNSCKKETKKQGVNDVQKKVYASEVIPFFDHWKLILGDGSNVGFANNFENKDFFYTTKENGTDWVVFKAPNAGDTHGTSNNTRTELAQAKSGIQKLQTIN